jgi:hypothetical protein
MGKRALTAREGHGSRARRELPDFSTLPERVKPEDLRTTQDIDPGPDPRGGRDTDTEFMLRNAGF